jgi:hypothetical protein
MVHYSVVHPLERPVFPDQETFQFFAPDSKVITDVWYSHSILRAIFLRNSDRSFDPGFGNDEGIGKIPSLK